MKPCQSIALLQMENLGKSFPRFIFTTRESIFLKRDDDESRHVILSFEKKVQRTNCK